MPIIPCGAEKETAGTSKQAGGAPDGGGAEPAYGKPFQGRSPHEQLAEIELELRRMQKEMAKVVKDRETLQAMQDYLTCCKNSLLSCGGKGGKLEEKPAKQAGGCGCGGAASGHKPKEVKGGSMTGSSGGGGCACGGTASRDTVATMPTLPPPQNQPFCQKEFEVARILAEKLTPPPIEVTFRISVPPHKHLEQIKAEQAAEKEKTS